jgi:hypothetical protein
MQSVEGQRIESRTVSSSLGHYAGHLAKGVAPTRVDKQAAVSSLRQVERTPAPGRRPLRMLPLRPTRLSEQPVDRLAGRSRPLRFLPLVSVGLEGDDHVVVAELATDPGDPAVAADRRAEAKVCRRSWKVGHGPTIFAASQATGMPA